MSGKLKAVGWSLVFLVGGFVIGLLALSLLRAVARVPESSTSLGAAALEGGALVIGYGLLTWAVGGKALGLGFSDFGLAPVRVGLRGFGWGALVGALLAALAMGVAVPLGHAAWSGDGGSAGAWLGRVVLTAVVLLPAALGEELAFRGVPLVALGRRFGRLPALVVMAGLFGLAHLNNPGVTGLAMANIAIAGVLLGVAFFTPGGLWTSTGVHFGWNLALAGLAAPVSGIGLPMPWLDYAPGAPAWLTGGGFGPEGGVVASLCLLTGCFIMRRRGFESDGRIGEAAS